MLQNVMNNPEMMRNMMGSMMRPQNNNANP